MVRNRRRRPVASSSLSSCPSMLEQLESRWMLHAVVSSPIADVNVAPNAAPTTIDLAATLKDQQGNPITAHFTNEDNTGGTKVTFVTSQGTFEMDLLDSQAPLTVANFLNYVNSQRYDNTIVHRSVPGFVIQAGGYELSDLQHIATDPAIPGEPDPVNRSNVRGTVAMALSGSTNDTATSEWFVNLADNSQNLDNQNGGFTVFARVPDMTVPDKIAALPTFDFSDGGLNAATGAFTDMPLANNYTPGSSTNPNKVQQSNYVSIIGASVTDGMTFTVTNDRPDLVNATLVGGRLKLSYASSAQGTADITVTARTSDQTEAPATDTFKVTVGTPGSVILGPHARKAVTFKDADGTVTTVQLKGPGAATVAFNGTGINSTDNKNGTTTVTASGNDLSVGTVTLGGTSAKSSLVFTSKGGNGSVDVGTITSGAALGSIVGKGVNLTGGVNVTGALGTLTIRSASNATISTSGGATPLTFAATGTVADTSLTATSGIKSLTAGAWTDTAGSAKETITTSALGKATVNGAFAPNLTVTKAITTLNVRGAIAGGTISAAGAGTISAASINGATIRTVGNLSKLSVKGAVSGSTIFAGVNSTLPSATKTLPAALTDFSTTATVGTLSIGSLASTNIAARNFSNVRIGTVNTDNGGTVFGIAADTYKSLAFSAGGKKFKFSKLNDPTKFTAPSTGDFKVVLL